MREDVNEPVAVVAGFEIRQQNTVVVRPYLLRWRDRRFKVETFGLYHPDRRGEKRIHVFQFSSGNIAFRLELDPDTLQWMLREVWYGD